MVFTQNQQTDIKTLATSAISECVEGGNFLEDIAQKVAAIVVKQLDDRFEQLLKKYTALENRVNTLEREKEELNKKVDFLEQYTRRNSVRVFGIPEKKNENTDELVLEVFNNNLGLQITAENVDRSHRVGAYNPVSKKPRGIIVKFTSYRYRNLVFQNKKKLKGTKLTIKEDLTRNRLEVLNCAADQFGYKNVWTRDGAVCINNNGKKHICQNMHELEKLGP